MLYGGFFVVTYESLGTQNTTNVLLKPLVYKMKACVLAFNLCVWKCASLFEYPQVSGAQKSMSSVAASFWLFSYDKCFFVVCVSMVTVGRVYTSCTSQLVGSIALGLFSWDRKKELNILIYFTPQIIFDIIWWRWQVLRYTIILVSWVWFGFIYACLIQRMKSLHIVFLFYVSSWNVKYSKSCTLAHVLQHTIYWQRFDQTCWPDEGPYRTWNIVNLSLTWQRALGVQWAVSYGFFSSALLQSPQDSGSVFNPYGDVYKTMHAHRNVHCMVTLGGMQGIC